ncbi:MAG: hypothetical protein GX076_08025, partial [Clostridiales bacterium]|nr:hypothetical protein [Clostridiales bacterium]
GYVVECTTTAGFGTGASIGEGQKLTLDSDVVVYVQDGAKFKVGNLRDITRKEGVEITFYDVYDKDGVYDIVLIKDTP